MAKPEPYPLASKWRLKAFYALCGVVFVVSTQLLAIPSYGWRDPFLQSTSYELDSRCHNYAVVGAYLPRQCFEDKYLVNSTYYAYKYGLSSPGRGQTGWVRVANDALLISTSYVVEKVRTNVFGHKPPHRFFLIFS